jgi:plasmid stability protein
MSKTVQIRNVPDDLHCTLRARAAQAGLSLSDYLRKQLRRLADRPTREALIERVSRRKPVRTPVSSADAVRAERERRRARTEIPS